MLRGMGKPITLFGEGKVGPHIAVVLRGGALVAGPPHAAWLARSRSGGTACGSCWPPWTIRTWTNLWPALPWRWRPSWRPGPSFFTQRARRPSGRRACRCTAPGPGLARASLPSSPADARSRAQIAQFSLLRAAARLNHAKRQQSNPDEDVAEERRLSHEAARCVPGGCARGAAAAGIGTCLPQRHLHTALRGSAAELHGWEKSHPAHLRAARGLPTAGVSGAAVQEPGQPEQ